MNINSSTRQPLSVVPEIPVPNLPGSVIVRDSVTELVEEMGIDLLTHALNCVRAFGDFHIALSAGKTPVPLYLHLMIDPTCRAIPWRKSHLWVVNEQLNNQPPDNLPNWNCIAGYFAQHAGIPDRQQHPINNQSLTPHHDYESEIRKSLEWRERGHDRLDYILLGIDEEGATAGLKPHSSLLAESQHLVARTTEPYQSDFNELNQNQTSRNFTPDRQCITMTIPLINASRFVAIMVTGKHKQSIIRQLIRNNKITNNTDKPSLSKQIRTTCPVERIQPMAGTLRWYLDRDACPVEI